MSCAGLFVVQEGHFSHWKFRSLRGKIDWVADVLELSSQSVDNDYDDDCDAAADGGDNKNFLKSFPLLTSIVYKVFTLLGLSTVFHFINSPNISLCSPAFFCLTGPFYYIPFMEVSFSPDIILGG